jgi:Ca2+-binding RTX toxin-like protein
MMRRATLVLAAMALALLLASGVAWAVTKIGTNGPDTLRGTNKADNLIGKGGNDVLFALAGRDNLLGGRGKDFVFGGTEDDRLSRGDKNLEGGPSNDIDKVLGSDGTDVFWVDNVPAAKDIIVCGGGFDWVLADRKDVVAGECERVVIVHGSREEVFQQEEEFFQSVPPSFFEGLGPIPF